MQVEVTARGEVPDAARQRAEEKVGRLDHFVDAKLLRAHVVLRQEANPSMERPALAEGEVNLDGKFLRAQVADADMGSAVDHLTATLERQIRRFVDRRVTERQRPPSSGEGEWRHGDIEARRPGYVPRAPEEREVVRRKTFAVRPMTAAEAAIEMGDLDHGFYLFRSLDPDVDAVVYRRDDGRIGVIGPSGVGWSGEEVDGVVREESRLADRTPLDDAIAEMDELDHRFLYFVDADSGRGRVIYLRYDGHYGLIDPRDADGQ